MRFFSCGRFLPVMLRGFPPAFYMCLPCGSAHSRAAGELAQTRGAHCAAHCARLNGVVYYPGTGRGIGAHRAPWSS